MEEAKKQYLSLLSEVVAAAVIIFGSDMAISRARSVASLVLNSNGNVVDIKGYAADAAQELINKYLELSGQSFKNIVDLVFAKYPQIKKVY